MNCPFVHLHLHTEYSIIDGILRVDQLVRRAVEFQMPAVAVTELGNMFSVVKFYRQAEASGIKPIIGVEIVVHDDESGDIPFNLLLLCRNWQGYRNLCRLVTKSYVTGSRKHHPSVDRQWLSDHREGVIAVSCADNGEIAHALKIGNHDLAKRALDHYLNIYEDNFCMELVRCGKQDEEYYIEQAVALARLNDVPLVASNNVRFLDADDYEAHEVRVCIQQGRTLNDPRRIRAYTIQQYFRSADEMQKLFSDLPEALQNTLRIAQKCNLRLELDTPHMPDFPVPAGHDQNSLLVKDAEDGLRDRVLVRAGQSRVDYSGQDYEQRLRRELDVITTMGFAGYFLIVADFIRWAKEQGIPVGPGRGSGAGSLVAYALGITALDPLEYDLLFERFLNPERVSLPDFDIDFCMERRDEVIKYVADRYGREQVSQIITYGSMAAKAVVRDVGRALGHPYGFVDQIAKLIPFELNMTLKRALEEESLLRDRYDNDEEVRMLIVLSMKLEGLCRNAGRHAGGVVIAPKPLTEYMPLYSESGNGSTVTQFDMKDVEAIGLVKFDFLGLRTLTIIEKAVRDINELCRQRGESCLDISIIPLDDVNTFDLIRKTETTAVFQLESDGMRKLIKRLQPDVFEDLIALVALFRPGPLQSGMVDDFVDRKHGIAKVNYALPVLEQVLKPTYGVILYQEQVMQIAQLLAGYTLGSADLLRRAMGKKKPDEMAMQRDIFVRGAIKNGIERYKAESIFDLMEKFADYGFNKSHSAAYAMIAYQTAWLKAHYPAAFMAAVLSSDMDNTDKVVMLCDEIRKMGLVLQPPSINESFYEFSVADNNTIRYGLGAIKGVGRNAIDSILQARFSATFANLLDFCKRCDLKKVNRRVIEALIRSGAMDCLDQDRAILMASLDKAVQFAEQAVANTSMGQNDMFGLSDEAKSESFDVILSAEKNGNDIWTEHERLQGEKDTLGFYLSGHPIEQHEDELEKFVTARLSSLRQNGSTSVIIAGYISSIRTRAGRSGRMADIRLDDKTARAPVILYPDTYHKYRQYMIKDQLVVVKGKLEYDDFYDIGYAVIADDVMDLAGVRARYGELHLMIRRDDNVTSRIARLQKILSDYLSGQCRVAIEYYNGHAFVQMFLGDEWRVCPRDQLLENLRTYLGQNNVKILYNINSIA